MLALQIPQCRAWLQHRNRSAAAAILHGRKPVPLAGADHLDAQRNQNTANSAPSRYRVPSARHIHFSREAKQGKSGFNGQGFKTRDHEDFDSVWRGSEELGQGSQQFRTPQNESAPVWRRIYATLDKGEDARDPEISESETPHSESSPSTFLNDLVRRAVTDGGRPTTSDGRQSSASSDPTMLLIEALHQESEIQSETSPTRPDRPRQPLYKTVERSRPIISRSAFDAIQEAIVEQPSSDIPSLVRKTAPRFAPGTFNLVPLTPSAELTQALRDAGFSASLPYEAKNKLDLSLTSPRSLQQQLTRHKQPKDNTVFYRISQSPSFQSILAQYIRASDRHGSRLRSLSMSDLVKVFSAENLAYLRARHYDIEDVISWAWILTAENAELAATRLLTLANSTSDPAKHRRNKAPVFLLMYLLRRKDVGAPAFRLLLIHAWNMLQNVHHPKWTIDLTRANFAPPKSAWNSKYKGAGNYSVLDQETFARLHVRLLRHARKCWPESISSIIATMVSIRDDASANGELGHAALSRLTFLYNRLLSLVGLPIAEAPFARIYINQRSQLSLLSHMDEFDPPLPITREGYQAVVDVQLRHSKIRREREWALLKSKAWPPWKEDKYGLDAEKGREYGLSRAKQTLTRALEAGYRPRRWERTASILSGWDTDESPTIQTRATLASRQRDRRIRTSPARKFGSTSTDEGSVVHERPEEEAAKNAVTGDGLEVWMARIQATRTLDEAWACFLTYKEKHVRWSSGVCFSMFRKLVFARLHKLDNREGHEKAPISGDRTLMPGDNLDVWPTSENPRERPYLKEPIPDEHQYMQAVFSNGITLGGRFLAFCLRFAETLGVGQQYLLQSNLDRDAIALLMGKQAPDAEAVSQRISPLILGSYVRLLCRAEKMTGNKSAQLIPDAERVVDDSLHRPGSSLRHAYRLLRTSNISYPAPWHDILSALAARGTSANNFDASESAGKRPHRTSSWEAMLDLVSDMQQRGIELNFSAFHTLCVGLEKIIRNARSPMRVGDETKDAGNNKGQLDAPPSHNFITSRGVAQLKGMFLRIVTVTTSSQLPTKFDVAYSQVANCNDLQVPVEPPSGQPSSSFPIEDNLSEEHDSDSDPAKIDTAYVLPRLFDVPNAAALHAFVRVLGMAHDRAGIVDLLRWMAWYAPEVDVASSQVRNGHAMLRKTLTAARVMIEGSYEQPPDKLSTATRSEHDVKEGSTLKTGHGEGGDLPASFEPQAYLEGGEPSAAASQINDGGAMNRNADFPARSALKIDLDARIKSDSAHPSEEMDAANASVPDGRGLESQSLVDQAREIIEQLGDEWGGWPTEEECIRYINPRRAGVNKKWVFGYPGTT